jgi:transcriptional regulator with XRE-family HTH domain
MKYYVIGENIKRFRNFRGKKQDVLAKEIGISRIMLSRYENGHVKFSFEILAEIANKLNVKIEELLVSN